MERARPRAVPDGDCRCVYCTGESLWSSDSADDRSIATVSGTYDPVFAGTFKQQVNFLLTSRERLQLSKAIQIYTQRRWL